MRAFRITALKTFYTINRSNMLDVKRATESVSYRMSDGLEMTSIITFS